MIRLQPDRVRAFRRKVLRFYRRSGRDLPFRHTTDPYRIVVAEVMLQQTQVDRMLFWYEAWLERWPDWHSLARAGRREVLKMWSGLGYNRRALYLLETARRVVNEYQGRLPSDYRALIRLPGIGPYVANAVLVFAFGQRRAAVDTNVRRVLIHELGLPPDIPAKAVQEIAQAVLPRTDPAEWHHALMDYGALALPRQAGRPRSREAGERYEGSLRQVRGEIIRRLTTAARIRLDTVARSLACPLGTVVRAATALEKEGLVRVSRHYVRLREDEADASASRRRPVNSTVRG